MSNNKNSILDTLVLNDVQRAAVAYIDGPELVFAGAGTGKTRVLTAKIAYLIDQGYRPGQIFAATFTNKAASEMRERVERFVSMPVYEMWIGTFHSLCAKILRREAEAIGYPRSFTIYDTSDQLSIIKKILAALDIDEKTVTPKAMLSAISSRKSSCITPSECEAKASGMWERETASAYGMYQKALKDQQAMDFDDLISNVVYMFRANEQILNKYRDQFRYVLVDEYQDTNKAQFYLVQLLSQKHGKIFAVGDDDQSIYGWRGAQIENILTFEKAFPGTKVFKLEENYRSTSAILKFANAAVKPNLVRAKKELWTSVAEGEPVVISRFRDDRQEADYVATECEGLLRRMAGTDVAVLFRTNAQSRVFEEAFRKRRLPYVLVGGTSFYERAEVKDCMAYLRLLVNPKDGVSFERIANVPARGLGDKAMESLSALAKAAGVSPFQAVLSGEAERQNPRYQKGFADLRELYELLTVQMEDGVSPADLLKDMLRESGYMDMLTERASASDEEAARVENVGELVNAMAAWREENADGTLSNFLEEVSLAGDVDGWSREDGAVNFMTLHSAKGLEFRAVFLVGVEDGIIPSRQVQYDESKVEEERRLFYVGSTRARELLTCSYAERRFRFGSIIPSEPSRFIADVPEELYRFKNYAGDFFGGGGRSVGIDDIDSIDIGNRGINNKISINNKSIGNRGINSINNNDKIVRGFVNNDNVKRSTEPKYNEFSQESEPQYRMGQAVTHKTFGQGKIVGISGLGPDMKLTVLFKDGVRRKLLARFANLDY